MSVPHTMYDSGVPVGMEAQLEPLLYRTGEIVPSFYRSTAVMVSHNANPDALVVQNGVPIAAGDMQNGTREVLRVGMVPPSRRYAIGEVVDGRAEVLSQSEFEKLDLIRYEEEIRWKSKGRSQAVAPDKRYIPTVRKFVAVKEHPTEPKFIPLGFPSARQIRKEPEIFYDEKLDKFVSKAEMEMLRAAKVDPRDAMIAQLQEQIAKLQGGPAIMSPDAALAAAAAPEIAPQAAPAMPSFPVPCGGKPAKSRAGVSAHARKCRECIAIVSESASSESASDSVFSEGVSESVA